ncbi:MAG: TonB-dependent receptor [Gemmatimonadetes bacterium]|nr:TonB-dependent receptor [Gemmatimonadota bacterium]
MTLIDSLARYANSTLIAVVALACGSVSAMAQQDPVALEELLVTVHRTPIPLRAISANVTVLEGEELEEAGYVSVIDALRTVPSLAVAQSGSFGSLASVFLRGGESDYVAVLIDGVQVNEPGGRFDFAHLPLQQIDRIEIVRGPSSATYGSDAVSGVVNIITRTGDGAARVHAKGSGGTYGSWRGTAGVEGGSEDVSYGFSATRFRSDGTLPVNNDYRNTSFNGRVDIQPDDRTQLTLSAHYVDHVYHVPTDGGGAVVDDNAFSFGDDLTLGLTARREVADAVALELALSTRDSEAGTNDLPDGPADSLGFFALQSLDDVRRAAADVRAHFDLGSAGRATAGFELEGQRLRGVNESDSEFGPSSGSSEETRTNRAYYAKWLGSWGALATDASLRFEDNETFGGLTTYSVGSAYYLESSRTKLRASVGRGIKEPTLFENFATGFAAGNPDLDPETSIGWELGVDQFFADGLARVSVSYFDQSFENLIQFTFTPPDPGDPNFFNVAAADTRGIEAEAAVRLSRFELMVGYTYLDANVTDSGFDEDADANFVEGERLLRRPEHQLAAQARVRGGDRAVGGVGFRYVGDRIDRDFSDSPAPRVTLPSYVVIDAFADVTVARGSAGAPSLTVTGRIENLFDEAYSEIQGFPARGRTIWLGGGLAFGGGR